MMRAWHLVVRGLCLASLLTMGWRPAAADPLLPTGPASQTVAGQLVVHLSGDASAANAAATYSRLSAAGVTPLKTAPELGLALVQTSGSAGLTATAERLVAEGLADWAEPNFELAPADLIPNDPYYSQIDPSTGHEVGQALYLSRMGMPAAWGRTTGDSKIIIAVIDTGMDLSHPDLAGAAWTNPGEIPDNGIDDDGNGLIDDVHGWNFAEDNNNLADGMGHGTHVAGIAVARFNNSTGVAGMAGGATVMPVKVFPSAAPFIGTYFDLIRGILYAADHGARVINLSLGATSYSRGEEAAVRYAWERGVVVAAAAGNDGRDVTFYPAAHPHVLAVAATAVYWSNNQAYEIRAGLSNWGDYVGVAAPGVNILSTYPVGQGSYARLTGTSMATPHVAGLAALVFSINPGLTPDQVIALIEGHADDMGSAGRDPFYGYGRINAARTLAATPLPAGPAPGVPPPGTMANCQNVLAGGTTGGDFEDGLGAWQSAGEVQIDTQVAYSGTQAVHFLGGANTHGVLTGTVTLPTAAMAGSLWFAYRISTSDGGWGASPDAPWNDWLTADLRTPDGQVLATLLRTGNTADGSGDGLAWDEYYYRMGGIDFSGLRNRGPLALVFTAGNDSSAPTDFYVDAVSFCATPGVSVALPLVQRP